MAPPTTTAAAAADGAALRGWLTLARCRAIEPRDVRHVAARLGGAAFVVGRAPAELVAAGLPAPLAAALGNADLARAVDGELRATAAAGWAFVHLDDPAYPRALAALAVPPPVLAVRGDPAALARPAAALVGARAATDYGLEMAARLAGPLAAAGVTVVSGLARGVDAAAHEAALDVGGATVAVMATGFDRVYPAEHRALADRIARSGALISEFPPGVPPRRDHFPRRNRVIAGLSLAVVVVEAALRSGSLVTARWALDEGRPVLAVPGRVGDATAEGTLALLRDGAPLATSAADVLAELPAAVRERLVPSPTLENGARGSAPEDGARPPPAGVPGRVWGALPPGGPVHVDRLAEGAGLPVSAVLEALFELQIAGLVEPLPGGRFRRSI